MNGQAEKGRREWHTEFQSRSCLPAGPQLDTSRGNKCPRRRSRGSKRTTLPTDSRRRNGNPAHAPTRTCPYPPQTTLIGRAHRRPPTRRKPATPRRTKRSHTQGGDCHARGRARPDRLKSSSHGRHPERAAARASGPPELSHALKDSRSNHINWRGTCSDGLARYLRGRRRYPLRRWSRRRPAAARPKGAP